MDTSITRRGQPCWYRVDGISLMAVNDACILESAIFQMLRKYFRDEPFYVDLIDLMHNVCRITLYSRCTSRNPPPGFVSDRNGRIG
jgi:farnesyl diphosphate synthase